MMFALEFQKISRECFLKQLHKFISIKQTWFSYDMHLSLCAIQYNFNIYECILFLYPFTTLTHQCVVGKYETAKYVSMPVVPNTHFYKIFASELPEYLGKLFPCYCY